MGRSTAAACYAASSLVLLSCMLVTTEAAFTSASRRGLADVDAGRSSSSLVAELMGGMKSPLSTSQASAYAQLFKGTGSVADLCNAGQLYCNARSYKAYHDKLLVELPQNMQDKDIPVFFRESELVVGGQMSIEDPRLQTAALERNRDFLMSSPHEFAQSKYTYLDIKKVPERAFLPAELSKTLPFTNTSASQVFKLDESSELAQVSSKTVETCNEGVHADGTTELQGEAAGCATSLEGMQSLLSSPMLLGPKQAAHVEALVAEADQNLQGGFKGKVMEVKMRASEASRHAVCHNLMYPSAVYFCHYLPRTRVYAVTLQQATASDKLLQAVAMCHLETTGWNPQHIAFQNLQTKPGESEACHWVLQGSVTFVPAA
ncbi:hypothetical protein L7F22_052266 [Adiantum nelumboides]|nr:hypothetical protein [Adiantum nelumboides]